jgi:hypothetical protein
MGLLVGFLQISLVELSVVEGRRIGKPVCRALRGALTLQAFTFNSHTVLSVPGGVSC